MAMQELQVRQVCASVEHAWVHVIDFDVSPGQKQRSTPGTPSLLAFEQDGHPSRGQRVLTQPLGPVHDVAVEWAGGAAHFQVALDGRINMLHRAQTSWR